MYLDDNVKGGRLVKEAIPGLGTSLPLRPDGKPDDGIRQDIRHLIGRCTDPLPRSPGLKQAAGTTFALVCICHAVWLSMLSVCICCCTVWFDLLTCMLTQPHAFTQLHSKLCCCSCCLLCAY